MKLGLLIDSAALAETVRTALDGVHKVQWVARDERQALRLCTDDPPELLLMQLGCEARVEFTRRLMVDSPCPILLLDMAAELKTEWVFKAMGYGALDVVQLPISDSFSSVNLALLLRKIKNITWLTTAPTPLPQRSTTNGFPRPRLIAIGASAGGPATLNVLLPRLPATLNAAVVLVQHLDDQFSAGMVEWLGRESAMPVRLAQAGELPQSGVVLLAGRNEHLCVGRHGELLYTPEPSKQIYRPSIDVLFQSLAELWQGEAIGVLLTGMGRDGALGLKAMRDRGFTTIAQDKASSAVWGMPKAAVAIDAASEVLPLDRIAARLIELCR